jgi:hypothetical protein
MFTFFTKKVLSNFLEMVDKERKLIPKLILIGNHYHQRANFDSGI